jgi:putative CocE/NonD family hydrolase
VPQLASLFGWFVDHGTKDPGAAPAPSFDRTRHLRNLPVAGLVQSARPAPSGFDDYMATPLADSRWASWGYLTDADTNPMPALIVSTWGDQTAGDALAWAVAQQRAGAGEQRVVMAPGDHCGHHAGDHAFGRLTVDGRDRPWGEWYLRFFDRHLRDRGDGLAALAPYQYFMLGEDRWLESQAWPPAEARIERWRLASGGRANTRDGDGRFGPALRSSADADTFTYDPNDPVPTRGGPICCTGNAADVPGPQDQAAVESRGDVLVYTSEPLAADLRIAGPLAARIAFSSDAPDTDLVLRLAHVRPDGLSTNIQEGALRLRYRDGFTAPAMMRPGTRYDAKVDLRSIAYRVPSGHRLRLHVTSSSFPRLERNLNTGAESNAHETRIRVARNTVHLDGEGSWLELPVLPGR